MENKASSIWLKKLAHLLSDRGIREKAGRDKVRSVCAFLIDGKLSARERAKGIKGSSCVASIPLYDMGTVGGHGALDWLLLQLPRNRSTSD